MRLAVTSPRSEKPRFGGKPPASRRSRKHVAAPDGTRIACLAAGVGRPIVMMHGAVTVADEWLAVADQFACSRRVVIVERRERSGAPPLARPRRRGAGPLGLASLPSRPRKEEALDGFAPTPEDFQQIQGPTTLLLRG